MNKLNLWDVAYVWPYCALAARYDEDSGDGDKNLTDFIEDRVDDWLPGAKVHRFFDPEKIDFTYAIEHEGRLSIYFLGTEGKLTDKSWKSNFSPQLETKQFGKKDGHVDFIVAGEKAADHFTDLVNEYRDYFLVSGHSRGGPRCMAAVRKWYRTLDTIPQRVVPFCSPPVFSRDGAAYYNGCGLGAVTIRPTMHHDPVDSIGLPVLKHVGYELPLPNIDTEAVKQHGIAGQLFYGHAYSSVFECLIAYCKERRMFQEVKWLNDTRWVAEV